MSGPIFLLGVCFLKVMVLAEDQFLDYRNCNNNNRLVLNPNVVTPQLQPEPIPIQLQLPQAVQTRPIGVQFPQPIQAGPLPVQQPAPVGLVPQLPLMPFQQQTLYGPKNVIYYIIPVPYPLKEKPKEDSTRPRPPESNEKPPQSNEKPGACPAETKRDCFKATPYQGCENDHDCEGTHKCCFDACLEQLVCKPSTKQ